jgi:hypothetical protein
MRKFNVNKSAEKKLPSKETIQKYKDFPSLSHEYQNLTQRPKVPLYKNKKMFLVLLLIVLVAFLLAQVNNEKEEDVDQSVVKEKVD